MKPSLKRWLIPTVLLISVFAVYRQVLEHTFTYFDDPQYVFRNPMVLGGLTWHSVEWAFRTGFFANYHPLTWLSHMLDVEIFGLWAGGHAFTNLIWHCANVLLVWRLTRTLSGRDSVGVFVALLFAVHPLNVESVANISQRKTVLSACFGLLALLAYLRFAERGGRWYYVVSLGTATLSLLAKPLFVTLPALLLLLDYWPLARIRQTQDYGTSTKPEFAPIRGRTSNWPRLIVEKIPFVLLAGASSLATFHFQHAAGAMSTAKVDLVTSLDAAVSSYFFYLKKLFWPSDLAVFYPLPESSSVGHLLMSAGILLAVLTILWSARQSRPYLSFGWLWFLGTLIPMAGFIRVGGMGMADRYSYIPLLGISFALSLLVSEWWASFPSPRPHASRLLLGCCVISLGCLAFVAHLQVSYWQSTERLFSRVLKTTQSVNEKLLNAMGYEAFDRGDFTGAIPFFEKSLANSPDYPDATANLGIALFAVGRLEEADPWLERAANLSHPPSAGVLNARGKIAELQGRTSEACKLWRTAIAIAPAFGEARRNLARALLRNHSPDEALAILDAGIRETPGDDRLHDTRAELLDAMGRASEAQSARELAAQQRGSNPTVPALQNPTTHKNP